MPSFGIAKFSGNKIVTTAASFSLLSANPSRSKVIFSNSGANDVWLNLMIDSAVAPVGVIGEGIRLPPNSVPFVLEEYQGPIAARAAVADTTIGVVEI